MPMLIFGFSVGGINIAVYIRMYMMMTFWVMLFAYLMIVYKKYPHKWYIYPAIFATVFAGTMTQYYFLIVAFFLTALYLFMLLFEKKLKACVCFGMAVLAGVLAGMAYFPAVIRTVFPGSNTNEMVGRLTDGTKLAIGKMFEYIQLCSKELFMGKYVLYILVVLAISLLLFVLIKRRESVFESALFLSIFGATILCYLFVVSKLEPVTIRYVYCIYPLIVLSVVGAILIAAYDIEKLEKIFVALGIFYAVSGVFYAQQGNVDFIYPTYQRAIEEISNTYAEVPAVYVTTGNYLVIHNIPFLAQHNRSLPITIEQSDNLKSRLGDIDELLVYVDVGYYQNNVPEKIAEEMKLENIKFLYDNTYTKIYVLSND